MASSLLLKQAGGCSIRPGTIATKRLLSMSTALTPPLKAAAPPPGIPPLVSRRAWNNIYKPPPRQPKGKDPLDEKPWPRNVVLTAYAVGATVVPYAILWFIAGNKSLRESIEPYAPKGFMPFLREWYGEEEPNANSYVDLREDPEVVIPKRLDHEITAKQRKEQESLQTLLSPEHPVQTRLRVYTESGFNLSEILELPGTTLANTKTLLAVLMQDRAKSIQEDVVTHVSVEFTDLKEASGGDDNDQDKLVVDVILPDDSATLQSQIVELIQKTNIFSMWHYFPEIFAKQQAENKKPKAAKTVARQQEEMRMAQLEYEIDNLEKLVRDPNTMRSFDDIEEELSRHKSELRRLKWKKRLNIFG